MNGPILRPLPPPVDIETKFVRRHYAASNRYLAELKDISGTLANQDILIATLPLLEAKDSSAVEKIITTCDELYKESLFENLVKNRPAKTCKPMPAPCVSDMKESKKPNCSPGINSTWLNGFAD
ncbi:MAG: Fic/DOC family N-terminal domain-containing protein [candidate division KSB1 bacterium]|nr:Fic/DOC family N-terminal domain-containing protein [candidate division KSB1 bacterium]